MCLYLQSGTLAVNVLGGLHTEDTASSTHKERAQSLYNKTQSISVSLRLENGGQTDGYQLKASRVGELFEGQPKQGSQEILWVNTSTIGTYKAPKPVSTKPVFVLYKITSVQVVKCFPIFVLVSQKMENKGVDTPSKKKRWNKLSASNSPSPKTKKVNKRCVVSYSTRKLTTVQMNPFGQYRQRRLKSSRSTKMLFPILVTLVTETSLSAGFDIESFFLLTLKVSTCPQV